MNIRNRKDIFNVDDLPQTTLVKVRNHLVISVSFLTYSAFDIWLKKEK